MTRRSTSKGLDRVEFRQWLKTEGLSDKVASDYLSRCKRVEEALGVCLVATTSTEDAFVQLMIDIHSHVQNGSATTSAKYQTTGSLRSAVRKLARFAHGKRVDQYPSNHGLSSYASTP